MEMLWICREEWTGRSLYLCEVKRKIPSNKVILSSDLKDVRKQVMQLFGERAP